MCNELKRYLLQVQEYVRQVAADVYPLTSQVGKVTEDTVARMTELESIMNQLP